MFLGHFAVGFAAKYVRPSLSLGTYFLAAQFVDLLWPTLLALNVEQVAIVPGITALTPLDFVHYPVTHSLLMALVWSVAGFTALYLCTRDFRGGVLIAGCVASHWLLDFVTHRPDLPIDFVSAARLGLGLWNHKAAAVAVEVSMFGACLWLYARATTAKDRTGRFGFWGLAALLSIIHLGNIAGPPPPSVAAIAWAGHLQWIFVFWAYRTDRHRMAAGS